MRILIALTFFLFVNTVSGQFLRLEFTGNIPRSNHPNVAGGESFIANLIVDGRVADSNDDDQLGAYLNAVVSGGIEFSGGFKNENFFDGFQVNVFNNFMEADGVSIFGPVAPTISTVNVISKKTNILVNDSFPEIGTMIQNTIFPTVTGDALSYFDDSGEITVAHQEAIDFSLVVSAVEDVLFGDVDCGGTVDLLDVAPFVELLVNQEYLLKADINQDGAVDLLDVAPFVDLLTGG